MLNHRWYLWISACASRLWCGGRHNHALGTRHRAALNIVTAPTANACGTLRVPSAATESGHQAGALPGWMEAPVRRAHALAGISSGVDRQYVVDLLVRRVWPAVRSAWRRPATRSFECQARRLIQARAGRVFRFQ